MKSIYTCPHCGAKSFNPIKKAFAGGLHTKGKVCLNCGRHCVNGMSSMIFSALVYLVALAFVLYVYFTGTSAWDYVEMIGAIVGAYVLSRLYDAFFGALQKPIRNDTIDV